MKVAQPIIREIVDNKDSLAEFETECRKNESEHIQDVLLNYPTVYIHNWNTTDKFEVYIGETNDIVQRTKQHYDKMNSKNVWQRNLSMNNARLFVIGHEHFNKSLTLDIENRLIQYMMSIDDVSHVHNERGNKQRKYYTENEFDDIFNKIWRQLRRHNKKIFPSEKIIKDSAIFKASPFHKLTNEQEQAKSEILTKISTALQKDEFGQLIFVEGEAGTGKTVLTSSTFYELFCSDDGTKPDIKCHLLVNHDEQIVVYEQIAERLGLVDDYGKVVSKPTSFINSHSVDNPVDVVFVDEAHLLLTQGKQSYQGENQLKDIIERSRVTVIMFDENQILTTEQFWEAEVLYKYREKAKKSDSYIQLTNQMRMLANPDTIDWIDSFTKNREIKKIPKYQSDYILEICDSPKQLDDKITQLAGKEKSKLSRLIATYDWSYSSTRKTDSRLYKFWEVYIDSWHKPWNRELESGLSKKDKKKIKNLAWAEQPQTINEVGSTFTIQGFDLNYSGVILGPSVKYRDGKIVFDPSESKNDKATRNRTLSNGTKQKFGETLIQHEVRVLMTRGVNGMFIYACDPELRKALKEAVGK